VDCAQAAVANATATTAAGAITDPIRIDLMTSPPDSPIELPTSEPVTRVGVRRETPLRSATLDASMGLFGNERPAIKRGELGGAAP